MVDLNSIMVRYDLDGDDQLNFKEFEMSLIPLDSVKELEDEHKESQNKLIKLRLDNTESLPDQLRNAHQDYIQLTGDSRTYADEIAKTIKAAFEFEEKLLEEEKKSTATSNG